MSNKWPSPVLINSDAKLGRALPLADSEAERLSERQIQDFIESHSELIPAAQFDPVFAPLVSIGREVTTADGRMDHLFVSSNGYLTIVETKLWKSPEAKRQVVAQLIGYAAQVSGWSYRHLEERFSSYCSRLDRSDLLLHEYVAQQLDIELTREGFADMIERNLRSGKMLLLIVGDQIRRSVEDIAEFLQQAANLQFQFGLLELVPYSMGGTTDGTLLVPHIVCKTAEITRAVVRIELSPDAAALTTARTIVPEHPLPGSQQPLTKTDYYNQLTANQSRESANAVCSFVEDIVDRHDLVQPHFTPTKLRLLCELPESSETPRPMLDISPEGWLATTYRFVQELNAHYPASVAERFLNALTNIDSNLGPVNTSDGRMSFRKGKNSAPLAEVIQRKGELILAIDQLVDDIGNTAHY